MMGEGSIIEDVSMEVGDSSKTEMAGISRMGRASLSEEMLEAI